AMGQLAAGIAHEINNPVGFVGSNLTTLETYLQDIFAIVGAYEPAGERRAGDGGARHDHHHHRTGWRYCRAHSD
ncbi:MAG: histidine kinase dimerization/phospho-acceptor domain-containing protein, partial [Rhodocyclaceae bacterium]|nr:histidine kinase dimerization/phospho-acceptor domain-containing protein [Rhodocyclaceae bacterium]